MTNRDAIKVVAVDMVDAAVLEALVADHPNLEVLDLRPSKAMDPEAIAVLEKLPKLRALGLHGWDNFSSDVGDRALAALARLPQLDCLHTNYCMLSGGTSHIFGEFPKLRRFWASYWCFEQDESLVELKARYADKTFLGFDVNEGQSPEDDEPALAQRPAPTRPSMVLFETHELPAGVRAVLPDEAGPHRCLFWIARTKSPAIAALMREVPEPDIDHVNEGMALASLTLALAGRGRRLADALRPEDTEDGPQYLGQYSVGFHTGPKEDVRRFLGERADVVKIGDMFADLTVAHIGSSEVLATFSPELRVVESCTPGWFVFENVELPITFRGEGGEATLAAPPGHGCIEISLVPVPHLDRGSEAIVDQARAVQLINHIFQTHAVDQLLDDGAYSSVFFATDRREEGLVEVVLLTVRDARVYSFAQQFLDLLPASPITELRYWDYLMAVRAEWVDSLQRVPDACEEIIDLAVLGRDDLQTFEQFREAVFES